MKRICLGLLPLIFFLESCGDSKVSAEEAVTGYWLILYPDHHIKTRSERDVYGRYQDSIVNLFGLKLIHLGESGEFVEVDSLFKAPGKWMLTEKEVQIREGGKGFNPFKASFEAFDQDTLQLLQYLPLENEKVKVVWHVKKVDGDTSALKLFTPAFNQWRKVPAAPETETAMRKRLGEMLAFYSEYLMLTSRESSYFLLARVPLPFRYYQHAIGMRADMPAGFINLFYNADDAMKAYTLLENTLVLMKNQFKRDENFVIEYALFFKRMTTYLRPL